MSSQPMSDEELAKLSTYEYLVESVSKFEKVLHEKDRVIDEKNNVINEKDEKIKELEARIGVLESDS